MNDREHEEWLENRNARKAAAKKKEKKPPVLPKKAEDTKPENRGEDPDGSIRDWVID